MAASPLARTLGVPLDRAGRVKVTPTLNAPGHDHVFVIGDLAAVHGKDGQPVPGVAPAAMQAGEYAAERIVDLMHEKPIFAHPFKYLDKGSLATIGRSKAVGAVPRRPAAVGPLGVDGVALHSRPLPGRLPQPRHLVLIEWAWAYLTFQRGARLITGPAHRDVLEQPTPTSRAAIGSAAPTENGNGHGPDGTRRDQAETPVASPTSPA